ENINNLKRNVVDFVQTFMIEHKEDLISACKKLEGEAIITVKNAVLRFNPEGIPKESLESIKRNVSGFTHSYLKRELGRMVEEAIPTLGVHAHIVNKIDLFTPQQLEFLVNRICKSELKALEYFGAVIGGLMGFWQIFFNAIVTD
ncbi:MAG: DUF445 family protein, partial [Cyanobacteria bacterium]|nr:DUF445 family protein [Cyanobacteriota bacterium]